MQTENAWEVYYQNGFEMGKGRDRPGTEIRLNQNFIWGGEFFTIPAVYCCGKGLVIDVCQRTRVELIRNFQEKWGTLIRCGDMPMQDENRQMAAENPLRDRIQRSRVEVNGKRLAEEMRSSLRWNPCDPLARKDEQLCGLMAHYGLDLAQGWFISRITYNWQEYAIRKIRSLVLDLYHDDLRVDGPEFRFTMPGQQVTFIHPLSNDPYTLTVCSCQPRERIETEEEQGVLAYPKQYLELGYTVTPELSSLGLEDCAAADRPRLKSEVGGQVSAETVWKKETEGGASESVQEETKTHYATSALHFAVPEEVNWRIVFYEKIVRDLTLAMIEPDLMKEENP